MSIADTQQSCFTSAYVDKADLVFLRPGNRYLWDEIVLGVVVLTARGTPRARPVSAVEMNTFRGFHRVIKNCPGAQEGFRSYFVEERINLTHALEQVETREQLHELQNRICESLRGRLKNVRSEQLRSYNKLRKPVDLYIEHLVNMALELDTHRSRLTPLLFLPLDSQILQHPELFTDNELRTEGLSRRSTYKDVTTETMYQSMQQLLKQKADGIASQLHRSFHVIYFDLIWGSRFRNWGSNLFETIPE